MGTDPAWYAFVMRFKQERAPPGVTREMYVGKLLQEGLEDVDIPKPTGLLHREPLFSNPEILLPHLYTADATRGLLGTQEFSEAEAFYGEAIKLPVWVGTNSRGIADQYIQSFKRVAKLLSSYGTVLRYMQSSVVICSDYQRSNPGIFLFRFQALN